MSDPFVFDKILFLQLIIRFLKRMNHVMNFVSNQIGQSEPMISSETTDLSQPHFSISVPDLIYSMNVGKPLQPKSKILCKAFSEDWRLSQQQPNAHGFRIRRSGITYRSNVCLLTHFCPSKMPLCMRALII